MKLLKKIVSISALIIVLLTGAKCISFNKEAQENANVLNEYRKVEFKLENAYANIKDSLSYEVTQYRLEYLSQFSHHIITNANTDFLLPFVGTLVQVKSEIESPNSEEQIVLVASGYPDEAQTDKPLSLTLKESIRCKGKVTDRNGCRFPYSFIVFKNNLHCFMTKTNAEGIYDIDLLPEEVYTVLLTQPAYHSDVLMELGDMSTKKMEKASINTCDLSIDKDVYCPYIVCAEMSTNYVRTHDHVAINIEMRGIGDYNYSETDKEYQITYNWSCTGGEIIGEGGSVTWKAPEKEGIYEIYVAIKSGEQSQTLNQSFKVEVNNSILTTQW